MSLDHAIESLKRGEFILLHDSKERENEIDMVVAAQMVEPEHIVRIGRIFQVWRSSMFTTSPAFL